MSAPVCHIPPTQPSRQPSPQELPSIPVAQANVQSLTASVNAMRQVINYITGRQGPQGPQGTSGSPSKPARWTEASRSTGTVRIYNPDDKTQFVDVEQINQLTMKDGVTGESWSWNRGG